MGGGDLRPGTQGLGLLVLVLVPVLLRRTSRRAGWLQQRFALRIRELSTEALSDSISSSCLRPRLRSSRTPAAHSTTASPLRLRPFAPRRPCRTGSRAAVTRTAATHARRANPTRNAAAAAAAAARSSSRERWDTPASRRGCKKMNTVGRTNRHPLSSGRRHPQVSLPLPLPPPLSGSPPCMRIWLSTSGPAINYRHYCIKLPDPRPPSPSPRRGVGAVASSAAVASLQAFVPSSRASLQPVVGCVHAYELICAGCRRTTTGASSHLAI